MSALSMAMRDNDAGATGHNARMGFRQMEPAHIIENANELAGRGFDVDAGVVNTSAADKDGGYRRVDAHPRELHRSQWGARTSCPLVSVYAL